MRQLSSTGTDPYTAITASMVALYGPSHGKVDFLIVPGGANEQALRMLEEIGTVENITTFLEQVKSKKRKLMGFGHRFATFILTFIEFTNHTTHVQR